MNIEARLRAVNKQLAAMGHDTTAPKSGPVDAAAFCAAIAKAAATARNLRLTPLRRTRLVQHLAGPAFRHVELLAHADHRRPSTCRRKKWFIRCFRGTPPGF